MKTTGRLATILIALTFFGCKGPLQTSAASTATGASAAPASGGGNRVADITDPTLNKMTAVSVTIPANWKFQGVLLEGTGTACSTVPSAVWRATSADGLSRAEVMPPVTWVFGTGPKADEAQKDRACLPLNGPKSAQEFLRFMAQTMHLQYVADVPVPEELNARIQEGARASAAKALADGQTQAYHREALSLPKSTLEIAMAAVGSKNGTATIKGRLMTFLNCTETTTAGATTFPGWSGHGPVPGMVKGCPSTVNRCTARVIYISGPESLYAGLVHRWDAPGMGEKGNTAWMQAWANRGWQQSNAMIKNSEAQTNQRMQQMQHTMAVQKEMGDEVSESIREQGARSREQTQIDMNARSTTTSDWVDYALDRQTVMNTNTGETYKIPDQVTVGGGALQQVHGNGQPY